MGYGTILSVTAARRLGRYRVGERIGTGGVADVFLAEADGAEGWGKTVVLKCLRPHVADLPEVVESLIEEARLAQRLQHGNIVQVFDFAVDSGMPYVVMEHVDGCTLRELVKDLGRRGERLPLEATLQVVEQVAAALAYAHRLVDDDGMPMDIVHRDVKPSNILLSRDGLVKLTDFGIAKVADRGRETLPGVLKGTPTYWSPEQAAGDPVDARADVFGLGVVLRELIGTESPDGRHLDVESTASRTAVELGPVDARVDEALLEVIDSATADKISERTESMRTLLESLRDWAADQRVRPSAESIATLVRRAKRDKPAALRVALDSALLSTVEGHATLQHSAASAEAPAVEERPAWRRPALAGLLAALVAAVVVFGVGGNDDDRAEAAAPRPTEVTPANTAPETSAPAATPTTTPTTTPTPTPTTTTTTTSTVAAASSGDEALVALDDGTSDGSAAGADTVDPPAPSKVPTQKVRTGLLKVNTLPWAEVTIDGKSYGRVPVEAKLPAGRHTIELSNDAVGTKRSVVHVKAGRTIVLTEWPS